MRYDGRNVQWNDRRQLLGWLNVLKTSQGFRVRNTLRHILPETCWILSAFSGLRNWMRMILIYTFTTLHWDISSYNRDKMISDLSNFRWKFDTRYFLPENLLTEVTNFTKTIGSKGFFNIYYEKYWSFHSSTSRNIDPLIKGFT